MNKITAEKCRAQFEAWWEGFYETTPREPWAELYSPEHDYYVDGDIDGQYDAWKASRQALEIALPVLEQQEMITDSQPVMTDNAEMITDSAESGDGWIEWGGGSQPVGNGRIDLKLRDGLVTRGMPAEYCEWSHDNRHTDIIAYRVVEQQEKASGKHQEGE